MRLGNQSNRRGDERQPSESPSTQPGSGSGGGGGTGAAPAPGDDHGHVRVTFKYRTTPYGHAIDALDEDGNTLMAYPFPEPAADATPGGIPIAWTRAALCGVIVAEIFLGAYLL